MVMARLSMLRIFCQRTIMNVESDRDRMGMGAGERSPMLYVLNLIFHYKYIILSSELHCVALSQFRWWNIHIAIYRVMLELVATTRNNTTTLPHSQIYSLSLCLFRFRAARFPFPPNKIGVRVLPNSSVFPMKCGSKILLRRTVKFGHNFFIWKYYEMLILHWQVAMMMASQLDAYAASRCSCTRYKFMMTINGIHSMA